MAKFTQLISKEGDSNKCYVKFVFRKVYIIINETISYNVADFFYSKNTQTGIGHSKDTGRALGHFIQQAFLSQKNQRTKIDESSSSWEQTIFEVPQVSVLRLTYFVWYISQC